LGLILLLHFGSFQLLSLFWRSVGIDARPIMSAPLRSTSLSEFWGGRWNLGFSQLAHDLIFQQLHRAWGTNVTRFFVFVVSGLIHRVVISLPAGGGYGLPTMYFMVQGAGVAVERSSLARRRRALPDPGRKLSSAIPLRLGERSAVAHAVQPETVVGAECVHVVDHHRLRRANAGAARWPKGRTFVVGHILLTSLFLALAATYLALAIWHLWLKSIG
jgi:hypothetical protein